MVHKTWASGGLGGLGFPPPVSHHGVVGGITNPKHYMHGLSTYIGVKPQRYIYIGIYSTRYMECLGNFRGSGQLLVGWTETESLPQHPNIWDSHLVTMQPINMGALTCCGEPNVAIDLQ